MRGQRSAGSRVPAVHALTQLFTCDWHAPLRAPLRVLSCSNQEAMRAMSGVGLREKMAIHLGRPRFGVASPSTFEGGSALTNVSTVSERKSNSCSFWTHWRLQNVISKLKAPVKQRHNSSGYAHVIHGHCLAVLSIRDFHSFVHEVLHEQLEALRCDHNIVNPVYAQDANRLVE